MWSRDNSSRHSQLIRPRSNHHVPQDTTRNGQTQSWTAAFKFSLATGMQVHTPELPEFFKNDCLIILGNANPGISNDYFDEARSRPAVDHDGASIGREFYRVVHNVSNGLHQSCMVNINPLFAPIETFNV